MTEKAQKLGNEFIEHKFLRKIKDNAYRLATPKDIENGEYLVSHFGLTKREYFSAMALQGIFANGGVETMNFGHSKDPVDMAQIAIIAANALLEELVKTE